MPVIINDFEVIMDQPKQADNAASSPQSAPPPSLRPDDIQRILRHYEQRKLRLLAD
jgi:hypothetical protein